MAFRLKVITVRKFSSVMTEVTVVRVSLVVKEKEKEILAFAIFLFSLHHIIPR